LLRFYESRMTNCPFATLPAAAGSRNSALLVHKDGGHIEGFKVRAAVQEPALIVKI